MPRDKLPKDREQLVLDNLNMVHYILQRKMRMSPSQQNYEDYYQEGCVGLILAAIRFDESKGFKFSTFAFPTIMGTIQQYKRNETSVKIPRDIQDNIFKIIQYLNKGFTPQEIHEITGTSIHASQYVLNLLSPVSLDSPIGEDDKGTLRDIVPDTNASGVYDHLLDEQYLLECIQNVSKKLCDYVSKSIWEEYIYSMLYGEKLTQRYFSNKYNISQVTVSRLLTKSKHMFKMQLQQR